MRTDAEFSPCRKFRYKLWRVWDPELPYLQVIGLNPSMADETNDDPTVRRCIQYAKDWGYGGLCMTNLYAYRATDPKVMQAAYKAMTLRGLERMLNYGHLIDVAENAGLTVAAWGMNAEPSVQREFLAVAHAGAVKLHHLGLTQSGFPKHPLYLRKDLKPIEWSITP
jgi:hypothetical protein